MNDMMFIDLFINNMNIFENDAYFQPITFLGMLPLFFESWKFKMTKIVVE